MNAGSAAFARRGVPWLVVSGVLVAALSLRGPIVAPTPVIRDIEADLDIGAAAAGLLTTAPVLMFAILTPLAALVVRRAGAELALMLSLSGVLVGTFVRTIPGYPWMLAGMIVIGAAITIGNIVVPVIVRRDVPPERVGIFTAAYSATLNAGSLLTSLLTAPLAGVIGWPSALLSWSAITVAGIVLWSVQLGRMRRSSTASGDRFSGPQPAAARTRDFDPDTVTGPMPVLLGGRQERSILRRPVTWMLLLAFGGQSSIYYALSTWLPTLAADELGLDRAGAGALASLFQGVAIGGAFLVPFLSRFTPPIVPALVIVTCFLSLTIGLLVAPQLMWLWLALGAVGHSGGFVVIFTTLVGVARSDAEAAGMSALIQGGGYALSALAAPAMGALHEATGGWEAGLTASVIASIGYGVVLLSAMVLARRGRR